LWKSEILTLCTHLGVPAIALAQSRQVDCDCGRFDLAAQHIDAIDALLQARAGTRDGGALTAELGTDLTGRLQAFIDEQMAYASFKRRIPYCPPVREADRHG
jgi:hypothetical protein